MKTVAETKAEILASEKRHCKRRRDELDLFTEAEREEFLVSEGWTKTADTLNFGGSDPIHIDNWSHPERCPLGVSPARLAHNYIITDQIEDARDKAVRAGHTPIPCNLCGVDMRHFTEDRDGNLSFWSVNGLVDVEVDGGFHSNPLEDMTHYRFSLCERCLFTMFRRFKVPVSASCGLMFP